MMARGVPGSEGAAVFGCKRQGPIDGLINGGEQPLSVPGHTAFQRKIVGGMVGVDLDAMRSKASHQGTQFTKQLRLVWQAKTSRNHLAIQWRTRQEHEGEDRDLVRLHAIERVCRGRGMG